MPAVIFFACLDLEQKSSIMDGHVAIAVPDNFFQVEKVSNSKMRIFF
jgi:hypothetical protein